MFSQELDNKDIVRRWLVSFWGEHYAPQVVEDFAARDMVLFHTSHMPRRGPEAIRDFMTGLRASFPDFRLIFDPNLIAEHDQVVVRWIAHGSHTGAPAEFAVGELPAATGRAMHYDGTSVFRIQGGRIATELGLADGVAAFQQLGLMKVSLAPQPFE
jgi:ketosteroid isomerase-like protein